MQRFIIVGGGLAGHKAALELRRQAPDASVLLICAEPGLPYDRPPLSKELLLGTKQRDEITLNDAASYSSLKINHVSGHRATTIDRQARMVALDDGRSFEYDKLLLATGSRPRRLPIGHTDTPVFYLRTITDALRLKPKLIDGTRVAVIGGGFIGLEVAAAARSRGCRVTVLEAGDRILSRGMPGLVSDWVHRLHARRGVEFRLSSALHAIARDGDELVLSNSSSDVRADIVVVGIGVQPNVELAIEAGLSVQNGLVVDERCQTSDPLIFGAGEVTCHPVRTAGYRRVESWKTSGEHGTAAARSMTGDDVKFDEVPWLWSDQFDSNIQTIGFPELADRHELVGDPQSQTWTLICVDRGGRVIGGVAVNRGRDAAMLRRAVSGSLELSVVRSKILA